MSTLLEVTRAMVTLGVDAHKRTHTVVAVDVTGAELGRLTVVASTAGHLAALQWAAQWSPRRWAVEDCRHVSRQLERELLAVGEHILRVPPRLTARERPTMRERGKSDPIDALAAARAALREPGLPAAHLDGPSRLLRLLVGHREDLVGERTRVQNRLRWLLHELMPEGEPRPRSLDIRCVLARLEAQLRDHPGTVARLARQQVSRCLELSIEIDGLEREIAHEVQDRAPVLLALHGCGALSAAKLIGEVAGISRFRSRAAFARYNGTAPIPAWSGCERFRLNRGGNRQINCVVHRIAVTQLQRCGPAQEYVTRRRAQGDTKREALRALRRRISDEVYRRLQVDEAALQADQNGLTNAA